MRAPRLLLFAAALVATAALLASPSSGADVQVKAKDLYFTPSLRTITVGDTVTWRNDGEQAHTVTSFADAPSQFGQQFTDVCDDGNPLTDEQCIEPGATFSVTFTTAGIYDYRCRPHGNEEAKPTSGGDQSRPCGMCGRVDVREAPGAPPTPTTTPTLKRTRTPTETPTATGSATATPTDDVTPAPGSTDGDGVPIAAPTGGASGGDGSGRALVAFLAIGLLSGAGFFTWRRFLATR